MALLVYDKATLKPQMIFHEETELKEYGSLLVDIPEGKELVGLTEDLEPIFEDRPLTLEERLAILESSQSDQDEAINDLASMMGE